MYIITTLEVVYHHVGKRRKLALCFFILCKSIWFYFSRQPSGNRKWNFKQKVTWLKPKNTVVPSEFVESLLITFTFTAPSSSIITKVKVCRKNPGKTYAWTCKGRVRENKMNFTQNIIRNALNQRQRLRLESMPHFTSELAKLDAEERWIKWLEALMKCAACGLA